MKAEESEEQFKIVSVFKDGSGKKHTWTLSNTKEIPKDSEKDQAEVAELLKIMTTLTIFETPAGVRRFTECMTYKSKRVRTDVEYEVTAAQPKAASSAQISAKPATTKQSQASINNRNNAPEKAPSSGSANVSTKKALATNSDTLLSLPEEAPPTKLKSCSAAPNPTTTEKPPVTKTVKQPEPLDTPTLRYGKTEEQIQENREARKKKKRFERVLSWKNRKKK